MDLVLTRGREGIKNPENFADNINIAPNQVNRQTLYLLTKHQNIYLIHATNSATYFSDL